jgi:hypothetical protein
MAERRDRWVRYRGEDDLELAVAEAMTGEEVRVGRGGAEALAPQEEGGAGGGHGDCPVGFCGGGVAMPSPNSLRGPPPTEVVIRAVGFPSVDSGPYIRT